MIDNSADNSGDNPRAASDDARKRERERLRHEAVVFDRMLGASLSDGLARVGQVHTLDEYGTLQLAVKDAG